MKKILKFLLILGLAAVVAGAGFGAYIYHSMSKFLDTPASVVLNQEDRYFYIVVAPGSTFDRVAQQLYEQGGISDVNYFKMLAYWQGVTGQIKAGEFEFNTGWKPEKVLDYLVTGRTVEHRVTIPEGLPWWKVALILEENGFVKFEDFEACVKDQRLLRRYGIPFDTAEGFLFPETYILHKPLAPTRAYAENIMGAMVQTFWRSTANIWEEEALAAGMEDDDSVDVTPAREVVASFVPRYARKNPSEVKRLVTLASLVEKESAVPDERPRIAGVYSNRLRINMILQCDPTVIYGLGPDFSGSLKRSHLRDASNLYNTYKFSGLPPGPICSPGAQAMTAAWKPEANKYFYFVATGKADGRHIFSHNYEEHQAAVKLYLKELERQREAMAAGN